MIMGSAKTKYAVLFCLTKRAIKRLYKLNKVVGWFFIFKNKGLFFLWGLSFMRKNNKHFLRFHKKKSDSFFLD